MKTDSKVFAYALYTVLKNKESFIDLLNLITELKIYVVFSVCYILYIIHVFIGCIQILMF